uniref:NADH-quinone oxidoreductase subunit H n=1 Tax=Eiseniibacteriota bacterium TaxID=2212470 RepID=A0A832MKF5_UNCEI
MTAPRPEALAWAVAGPAVALGLAPLLDGVARRLRARLEARVGPPLLQGYLDLAKLSEKREVSAGAGGLAETMPVVALAAAGAAGALLPAGGVAPLGFAGDAVVVLYLLGLSSAALALAGSAAGSPYGLLGAGREMLLMLAVEPVAACALFVAAIRTGTFRLDGLVAGQAALGPSVSSALALAGMLLALAATMGRPPFDLAEAEQELMGGPAAEYGGRRLALLRWAALVRALVVAWLVAEVLLPAPVHPALAVPLAAVKTLAVFAFAAAAGVLVARLRLDHARAWAVQLAIVMGFAVVFALVGA